MSAASRPPVPLLLRPLVDVDYLVTTKSKSTLQLPLLTKAVAAPPAPPPLPTTAYSKQDWELVLWLALFSVSRLSPYYCAPVLPFDVAAELCSSAAPPHSPRNITVQSFRSSSGAAVRSGPSSSARPPEFSSASPARATVVTPSAASGTGPATGSFARTMTPTLLPPLHGGADDYMSVADSIHSTAAIGDAKLPFETSHCVAAIRCLCVMLSLRRDQVGFTVDQLHRWATAPQQFGVAIRRAEDIATCPAHERRRRDATLRTMLAPLLADVSVTWYLWWCAGMYGPIRTGEVYTLHPVPVAELVHCRSSGATEDGEQTLAHSTASAPSHPHPRHPSDSSIGHATGHGGMPAHVARTSSLEIASMCTFLLEQYLWGALDVAEDAAAIATVARCTKEVSLTRKMHVPSVPCCVSAVLRSASVVLFDAADCGLLDLTALEQCTSLRTIRVPGNRLRALPPLLLWKLRDLTELDVSGNLLKGIGIEPFLSMGCSSNVGAAAGEEHSSRDASSHQPTLAARAALEVLDVAFNQLMPASIALWLSIEGSSLFFQALCHLNLSGNTMLHTIPVQYSELRVRCPKLRKLQLCQLHLLDTAWVHEAARCGATGHTKASMLSVTLPQMALARAAGGHRCPLVGGDQLQRGHRTLRCVVQHVIIALYLYRLALQVSTRTFLATTFPSNDGSGASLVASRVDRESNIRRSRVLSGAVLCAPRNVDHMLSENVPTATPLAHSRRRCTLDDETERILMRFTSKRSIQLRASMSQ